MDKNLFNESLIADVLFDFGFKPFADIERYYLEFEQRLDSIFDKKAVLTKAPDNASLNIPRFVLSSRHSRVLEVSLVNAVFKAKLGEMKQAQAIELYENKVRAIYDFLKAKQFLKLKAFAAVITIQFPLKDINYAIANDFFDDLLKINKPTGYKGLGLTLAQSIDGLLIKNVFEDYEEMTTGKITVKDAEKFVVKNTMHINVEREKFKLTGRGIQNKIIITLESNESKDDINVDDLFKRILKEGKSRAQKSASFLFGGYK